MSSGGWLHRKDVACGLCYFPTYYVLAFVPASGQGEAASDKGSSSEEQVAPRVGGVDVMP